MRKLIFLLTFIFLTSSTLAINITEDVTFNDGTYDYTANRNFTANSFTVSDNLYINGYSFCDWTYYQYLTTSRICDGTIEDIERDTKVGLSSLSGKIPLLALVIATIVILTILLAIYYGEAVDLKILLIAVIVIIILIIVLSVGQEILNTFF